ncbi:MAG: tyrosine-type recombinase/integrase [Halanaerobiales bacterium]|nr:tyrosine-type recombinase/integrase [Halanaerobiales bacterium]
MKKIIIPKKSQLTLKDGWKNYVRYCKVKNLAEVTIKSYRQGYDNLENYLGGDFLVSNITLEHIESLILKLKGKDTIKDITINTRLRSIRAFLYYYMEKGYIDSFKIELLRVQIKQKQPYTDQELKKLLVKPNLNETRFSVYRNWVIINFVLGTGVRLSTLNNLKNRDILLDTGMADLRHTKNRSQQIIPLPTSLINILEEYMSIRKGEKSDALFCNEHGKKLHKDWIKKAIYIYNKRRGVNKTSLHLLRHTFAKKYIMAGGNPLKLQKLLGHKSMRMVKRYVNLYSQDLKKDYDRFNPLENIVDQGEYIEMNMR